MGHKVVGETGRTEEGETRDDIQSKIDRPERKSDIYKRARGRRASA